MHKSDAWNLGRMQGKAIQILELWTPDSGTKPLMDVSILLKEMEDVLMHPKKDD